jgi:hypothetical protein
MASGFEQQVVWVGLAPVAMDVGRGRGHSPDSALPTASGV